MRFLGLLGIGLAAAAPAGAQDVLDAEQLDALANQARAFVPKDEFDVAPALPSVAGKRFSVTVAPLKRGPDNLICDGFPSWGYWPQDGKLEVGAMEGTGIKSDFAAATGRMFASGAGGSDFSTFVSFRSFRCNKVRLPSYEATNGFGAKFTVEKSREEVTAIGGFRMIDTDWKSYWSTQAVGDEARQLSQNIRVRLEGTLEDWAPGRPVLCGSKRTVPETRLPLDETLDICMFNGAADRFEVIDARTGAVLYGSTRS